MDAISIHDSPQEVEDRVTGHWKGDLLVGTTIGAIATLVGRKSRFTLLCKVTDKKSGSIVSSLT